jgi:1,4-alpha-glucan branching enzyme
VPYVTDLGYTHLELMPVTEHPLDESWGYQTTGYFAPSSRFGSADDFRHFVDACHQRRHRRDPRLGARPLPHGRLGPGALRRHRPLRARGPAPGRAPGLGHHIFNYGRGEVKGFLLASAHYWLSEFHLDGLRVDAVASMLYLDYSRKAGEWLPNKYGGRENLEAIDFLRE